MMVISSHIFILSIYQSCGKISELCADFLILYCIEIEQLLSLTHFKYKESSTYTVVSLDMKITFNTTPHQHPYKQPPSMSKGQKFICQKSKLKMLSWKVKSQKDKRTKGQKVKSSQGWKGQKYKRSKELKIKRSKEKR